MPVELFPRTCLSFYLDLEKLIHILPVSQSLSVSEHLGRWFQLYEGKFSSITNENDISNK